MTEEEKRFHRRTNLLLGPDGRPQLINRYLDLLDAVEAHHAARGHDRCWEEDEALYRKAGLTPGDPERPPIDAHRSACDAYRAGLYSVPVDGEPTCVVQKLTTLLKNARRALDAAAYSLYSQSAEFQMACRSIKEIDNEIGPPEGQD